MKAIIKINPRYVEKMLKDSAFHAWIEKIYDHDGQITKFFVVNSIKGNDEKTFRTQILNFIKVNFCRIFNISINDLDVGYTNKMIPNYVIRYNVEGEFKTIATITDFFEIN